MFKKNYKICAIVFINFIIRKLMVLKHKFASYTNKK